MAFLAFILLPERRVSLLEICRFISYRWADHWFTDQIYNADDYQKLCSSLQIHEKAFGIKNHRDWKFPEQISVQNRQSSAFKFFTTSVKRRRNFSLDLFCPTKHNNCILWY